MVMEMREKLIELITDCTTECYSIPCNECDYFDKPSCASQWKADYLIANGVTIPVRCKECKHWHEETGWCTEHSHFIGEDGEACHPSESPNWKMLNADDFCSYGERRNDV